MSRPRLGDVATRTLEITFIGNAKPVQDAFDKVGDSGGKLQGKLSGVQGALGGVATVAGGMLAAGAVQQLGGFLIGAGKAAAEDAAATARLEQALRNSGGAFDENLAKVNARIDAGQKLAFSDDDVRDSFQQLLSATGDTDEALRRQALAMDFARGAGIPLEQASKLLGKVTEENVEVFKRMGITIGEGATEAEAFAVIQGKFAGQSEAYAKSTSGQMEVAKIRMGELKEQIGTALLPAFTAFATFMLTTVLPAVEKFADAAGPKIQEFAENVKKYWESDIKPALDSLAAAWEKLEPIILPLLKIIADDVERMAKTVALALGIIVDLLGGDFSGAWEKAKEIVDVQVQFIKDTVGNLKDFLGELLPILGAAAEKIGKAIFDGIWEGLGDLWQLGADIIDWVLQGLKAMAGGLIAEAKRIGGEILSALNPVNIAKGSGGLASGLFDQVADAAGGGGGGYYGPGGMGQPSSPDYKDPRGWDLTADDILRMRAETGGFVGGAPQVIQLVVDGAVLAQVVAREQARGY